MRTNFTPLSIQSDGFWIVKKQAPTLQKNNDILVVDIIGP